ncbi:MAG: accessory gene regulator B family protein [Oscillospiraceae bacterium]|nr:accessory gene regulator B family protein [Oscillospiraceae bacterium]
MADDIAIFLIQRRIIDAKDRDLCCYGAEVLLLNSLNLLTALAVTIFSGTWLHFLIFMLLFVPLRMCSGGYHAKKSSVCMIVSTVLYIAAVSAFKFFPYLYKNIFAIAVLIAASVFIFVKAPIINENNVLDRKSFKRNRIISRILICLDSIIFITLALLEINSATSVMIFIMLIGFLMMISEIKSSAAKRTQHTVKSQEVG